MLRSSIKVVTSQRELSGQQDSGSWKKGKELGMSENNPETTVQKYLSQQGCSWVFNSPHTSHISHVLGNEDVLCALMAEVAAIINARSLIQVSNYPEDPFILSPSMLLNQKVGVQPILGHFTDKDFLTKQWRQVQVLANRFWTHWREEYLPTLQYRRKWNKSHQNLWKGDVVLLKDRQAACND